MAETKPTAPDPVARLCDVAVKAIAEFSVRSDRDHKLIKSLVDALIVGADKDLQVRRIELETTGTAQAKAAETYTLAMRNGFHPPNDETPDLEIPGRA